MDRGERETLEDVISEQIMNVLGMPSDLRSVQVRKVGIARYRVNVILGEHAGAVRIAHSYFVGVDGDGGIIASTPNIKKQY